MVRLLIDEGAGPDHRDKRSDEIIWKITRGANTALWAPQNGYILVVRLLLGAAADPHSR